MNEKSITNDNFVQTFMLVCIVFLIGFVIGISKLPIQNIYTEGTTTTQTGIQNELSKKGNQTTGNLEGSTGFNTGLREQKTGGGLKVQGNTKTKPTNSLRTLGSTSGVKVLVKGFPEDSMATQIATYAYKISNGDLDFLMTLKAENGGFNMYQQSNVYKNGKREESYGLCQMMKKYHPEVNTKIFWESWMYQVEICYKKYSGGTKFYGYFVRMKYKNDFIIK